MKTVEYTYCTTAAKEQDICFSKKWKETKPELKEEWILGLHVLVDEKHNLKLMLML